MDQLMKLAADSGMDAQQGKDSVGGILKLVQNNVKPEDFSKIEAAIPGAKDAAQEAANKANNGGDASKLLNSAMGMFGGSGNKNKDGESSGGGLDSLPQLLAFLGDSGVDAQQVAKLLPQVTGFLNKNANVDVSSVLGASGDSGNANGAEDLADKAKGFLGGFLKQSTKRVSVWIAVAIRCVSQDHSVLSAEWKLRPMWSTSTALLPLCD